MRFKARNSLTAALIGCSIVLATPGISEASLLDTIQTQPDNFGNVVRIHFTGPIFIERKTLIGKSNVILVYFHVIDNRKLQVNTNEYLSSKPIGLIPGVTVSLNPQPNQISRTLEIRFSGTDKPVKATVQLGIDGKSLDIIFGETGKPQLAVDAQRYAIALMQSDSMNEISSKVIPTSLQDYAIFTSQQSRNGSLTYELDLGYFITAQEAERVRSKLLARFPQAQVVDLKKRKEESLNRLAEQTKPQPSLEQAQQAAIQGALPEVEEQAAMLMPKAREAMNAGNYELAINTFNQILLLPPNAYSQEAQELVGVARQKFGELDRARTEFELYLKLFPTGPGADRVREHLAEIEKLAVPGVERRAAAVEEGPTKTISGSLSQTYYGGKSLTQTAFGTPTTPGSSTLSTTDQSELRTFVNVNGTYRDSTASHKLAFEDDNIRSFLSSRPSRNRLRILDYEYKGLLNGVDATIGRQSGSRLVGVPTRFDGASLAYHFTRRLSASIIAGLPVDFPALKPYRKFVAANINGQNFGRNWGFDSFVINQTTDGIQDRQAVGGDLFYIVKPGNTVSTHIDYDTSYSKLNIGRVQGDFINDGGTQYSFYFDRSLTPFLSTTNALYSTTVTSMSPVPQTIKELLQTRTEDQIRALALATTAVAYQGTLSFTVPFSLAWKFGNDLTWSKTGALPAQTLDDGTVIPATPATGNIYTYSVKAIGANLFTSSDTNVFSLSLNKSETSRGATLLYNNQTIWNNWTFKPIFLIQQQHTETTTETTDKFTLTPDFTVSYQFKDVTLEVEYTYEHTVTDSNINPTQTYQHHFFSLGYRWDF